MYGALGGGGYMEEDGLRKPHKHFWGTNFLFFHARVFRNPFTHSLIGVEVVNVNLAIPSFQDWACLSSPSFVTR